MLWEGSQMGDKCSVKRSVIGRHCRIGSNVKVWCFLIIKLKRKRAYINHNTSYNEATGLIALAIMYNLPYIYIFNEKDIL